MKKLLALVLALSFVFIFVACGEEEAPSDTASVSSSIETLEFVKPENYASVVLVTINPQFRLYLDINGDVLAVEPVNSDAKSIVSKITAKSGDIKAVIENVVTATKDGGFVKENATVNFEVTEVKNTEVDTSVILDKAKTSAESSFRVNGIAAEVKTSVADDIIKDTSSALPSDASEPAHSHSFSTATCEKPAVCSCGATDGEALGHNYKDGVCTRCKAVDSNHVFSSVISKKGAWDFLFMNGDTLYSCSLYLSGTADDWGCNLGIGDYMDSSSIGFDEMKSDCIVYNGKYYYVGRGDGDALKSVAENKNTVTVTDLNGNQLVLTKTGEKTMTVKTSPASFTVFGKIPEGIVLTFSAE